MKRRRPESVRTVHSGMIRAWRYGMASQRRRSIRGAPSRPRSVTERQPLAAAVAVVAGATRGAGRGIARALGEAGATVYCTGRSVRGNPSPSQRSETIDETASMIQAAGGKAIAVRVDHTVETEVAALFKRIARGHKRIDVVAISVAGEDPLM